MALVYALDTNVLNLQLNSNNNIQCEFSSAQRDRAPQECVNLPAYEIVIYAAFIVLVKSSECWQKLVSTEIVFYFDTHFSYKQYSILEQKLSMPSQTTPTRCIYWCGNYKFRTFSISIIQYCRECRQHWRERGRSRETGGQKAKESSERKRGGGGVKKQHKY